MMSESAMLAEIVCSIPKPAASYLAHDVILKLQHDVGEWVNLRRLSPAVSTFRTPNRWPFMSSSNLRGTEIDDDGGRT
ncbi:MAG TPA: hypothetical protein VGP76_21040 [Planctomycetaceae bacterium]|jgi:hypothetical protein|nr:hypothetical protein [Planctomycetaceae bacterium]